MAPLYAIPRLGSRWAAGRRGRRYCQTRERGQSQRILRFSGSRSGFRPGAASRNRFRNGAPRPSGEAEPTESHSKWPEHPTTASVLATTPGLRPPSDSGYQGCARRTHSAQRPTIQPAPAPVAAPAPCSGSGCRGYANPAYFPQRTTVVPATESAPDCGSGLGFPLRLH